MCFRPNNAVLPVMCPSCGTANNSSNEVCKSCGASLGDVAGGPVGSSPRIGAPAAPGAPAVPDAPKAPGAPEA